MDRPGTPEDEPRDELTLPAIDIPDDPRALDDDRWQLYEELAAKGEIRHTPDTPPDTEHPTRWRDGLPWFGRHGSRTLPLLFLIWAVAAMIATFAITLIPRTDAPPQTAPLATSTVPDGDPGGLLPASAAYVNNAPRDLRSIRPATLFLVPGACDGQCAAALEAEARVAEQNGQRLFVTVAEGSRQTVDASTNTQGLPILSLPTSAWTTLGDGIPRIVTVAPDGLITSNRPAV